MEPWEQMTSLGGHRAIRGLNQEPSYRERVRTGRTRTNQGRELLLKNVKRVESLNED